MTAMGNAAGGPTGALEAARTVYNTRVKLLRLFRLPRPGPRHLHRQLHRGLNIAISGLIRPGDHVIPRTASTTASSGPCTAWRKGARALDVVPADQLGRVPCEDLGPCAAGHPCVVCHPRSNLTGKRADIARIGEWPPPGGPFYRDASQTAGSAHRHGGWASRALLHPTRASWAPGHRGLSSGPGWRSSLEVGGSEVTPRQASARNYPNRPGGGTSTATHCGPPQPWTSSRGGPGGHRGEGARPHGPLLPGRVRHGRRSSTATLSPAGAAPLCP